MYHATWYSEYLDFSHVIHTDVTLCFVINPQLRVPGAAGAHSMYVRHNYTTLLGEGERKAAVAGTRYHTGAVVLVLLAPSTYGVCTVHWNADCDVRVNRLSEMVDASFERGFGSVTTTRQLQVSWQDANQIVSSCSFNFNELCCIGGRLLICSCNASSMRQIITWWHATLCGNKAFSATSSNIKSLVPWPVGGNCPRLNAKLDRVFHLELQWLSPPKRATLQATLAWHIWNHSVAVVAGDLRNQPFVLLKTIWWLTPKRWLFKNSPEWICSRCVATAWWSYILQKWAFSCWWH